MTGIGRSAASLESFSSHEPGRFGQVFGEGENPRLFQSPGRVNLMGAHLDYNGGPALPLAIDRGTWLAARRSEDRVLSLTTSREQGVAHFDLGQLPGSRTGTWVDYPLGVVHALMAAGHEPRSGLHLAFGGDLPVGAGLSSSASLASVAALAFDKLWELGLDPLERVDFAWRAEREFVGVPCGILDPYAIGLAQRGMVLCLECAGASYSYVPIDWQQVGVAVVDSGVQRALRESGYAERVRECARILEVLRRVQPAARHLSEFDVETLSDIRGLLSEVEQRRAEHVLREVERTRCAKSALEVGDYAELGRAMFACHESLRDLYEVSCPELDHIVAGASSVPGVLGARLVGAGFGGSALILFESGAEESLTKTIGDGFEARFARTPVIRFFQGADGPGEIARP